MRIDVFTIFPHAISEMAELSVLGRAQGQQKLDVRAHDLRMNATDPHKTVDDKPFGGGPGMVIRPDVVEKAVMNVSDNIEVKMPLVYMTPSGKSLKQHDLVNFSQKKGTT